MRQTRRIQEAENIGRFLVKFSSNDEEFLILHKKMMRRSDAHFKIIKALLLIKLLQKIFNGLLSALKLKNYPKIK